jgi:hypothetical protein
MHGAGGHARSCRGQQANPAEGNADGLIEGPGTGFGDAGRIGHAQFNASGVVNC